MITLILFSYQKIILVTVQCTLHKFIGLYILKRVSFCFSFSGNEKRAFLVYYCLPLFFGRLSGNTLLSLWEELTASSKTAFEKRMCRRLVPSSSCSVHGLHGFMVGINMFLICVNLLSVSMLQSD